jgi:prepilin-type N-terminal cleavage/methylation domain-containing protein
MEEKHNIFRKISDHSGFTLIELIVVIAIIAILTAIGTTYFTYLKFRSGDSQAFVEGRNLMTAVNDAFLNLEDIDFDTSAAGITGPIGNKTTDDNPRAPIFNMSNEIRARMVGQSTPSPGGGYFEAYVWSINGTVDDDTVSQKKEYWYCIDENANVISAPSF